MGCDKPENLPAPTSLQAFDDLALSIRQSGAGVNQGGFSSGANAPSFPSVSVPAARPIPGNVDEMNNFLMANLKNLNALHHHQLEPNLINIRNVAPSSTPSEMSHSMGNVAQMYHSNMDTNMPTLDSFLKEGVLPAGIENPGHSMSFIPMQSNAGGCYPAAEKAGEATDIRQNSLQASGSPFDTGYSLQNTKTIAGIGSHDDVKANSVHFSSPENIDGSFLTLGIGSNIEDRSKFRTNGKEVRSRLEEAVLPQIKKSHVQPMRRNFTVQGVPGGIKNFHHDSSGLLNSAMSLGLSTFSSNGNEVTPSSRTSATPFIYSSSAPDMLLNSSNSGNLGAVGKADLRFSECHPFKDPQGDLRSSLPCSSNSLTPHLGYAKMLAAPESAQPVWLAAQPMIKQQQNSCTNISMNQSFTGSPTLGRGGTHTVKQDHLGQQPFVNAPNLWGNKPIHKRVGSQIAGLSGPQPAGDQFTRRPGVDFNNGSISQATREGFVTGTGGTLQIRKGNSCHLRDNGPAMHPNALLQPPLAIGQPHGVSPAQFNVSELPYPAAQGIPTSKVDVTPQASYIHGHASLKRRASGAPPIAPMSQRRRTLAQHSNEQIAHKRQTFNNAPGPASSPSLPSPRVKWQGLEESDEPIGEKCLLCKRDVSFAPEGPVTRPAILPAIAVLPCGHVFHDHCLQIITPEDQSKDPPCIPCALGET